MAIRPPSAPRARALALLLAAWLVPGAALAQSAAPAAQPPTTEAPPTVPARGAGPGRPGPAAAAPEGRRLPADRVTRHSLALPDGRNLTFTATAGSLPLVDEGGRLQAEIAFTAYALAGPDAATRPVTFAINGGPGAASAYLHLGLTGPWRLPVDERAISPSASPTLVPNAETWLDFTDLVFIDPVGTGYSRAAGGNDEARNRYYAVDADASVLAAAIARWLREADRLASPKFYLGESYGGFRGPLIARKLQGEIGIGLSGLVLLSPVLDFAWLQQPRHAPFAHATRLPSLAAAAIERGGGTASRETLAEAERYAAGDYLVDLVRGLRDPEAVARLSARVAALTGLEPAIVRRAAGRVGTALYLRESGRAEGRVGSAYDPRVTGLDPDPSAGFSSAEDPLLGALKAPLTEAVVAHTARVLEYRVPDLRYELLSSAVNRAWRWEGGRGAAEAVGALRESLALDQNLRVLVAHGFTDLVTPYFASKIIIDQLPELGDPARLALAVYPGGHMFYFRDGPRAAFRADVARLYETALRARRGAP